MNKYDLIGKAEVVVTTSVYASSIEEAIEVAKKRDMECSDWGNENQDEEVWVSDLMVTNIKNIQYDRR